jgi:hypothetical protein
MLRDVPSNRPPTDPRGSLRHLFLQALQIRIIVRKQRTEPSQQGPRRHGRCQAEDYYCEIVHARLLRPTVPISHTALLTFGLK